MTVEGFNSGVNGVVRGYNKTKNNLYYGTLALGTGAAALALAKPDVYVRAYRVVKNQFGKDASKKIITGGVLNSLKNIGGLISKVALKTASKIAKMPKAGIVGLAAAAAGIYLAHNHAYNSGKIDQEYTDKQKVIHGFGI